MQIVPILDELEDDTLCLSTRAECAPVQQFTFQGGEFEKQEMADEAQFFLDEDTDAERWTGKPLPPRCL